MHRLVAINSKEDIDPRYRDTPIGRLLEYHNLNKPFETYKSAELLVGMCMDNRKQLRMPDNFAFIIRSGGGNLRYSEFQISFAISAGGVQSIALIGHTNCGMVNVISRRNEFVNGLMERAGWDKEQATLHFDQYAPIFEIGNEVDFVLSESKRLRLRYPKILIAPMIYKVEDGRLYVVHEL